MSCYTFVHLVRSKKLTSSKEGVDVVDNRNRDTLLQAEDQYRSQNACFLCDSSDEGRLVALKCLIGT